jgi:hypothetical protein
MISATSEVGLQPGPRLFDIGGDVAMQQHGALGDTGGAAGVLQKGDVVRPDWRRLERLLGARLQHMREADAAGQPIGGDHAFDPARDQIDDQSAQPHQISGLHNHRTFDFHVRPGRGRRLREVFEHEQEARAGVVHLVLELMRRTAD